jgi:TolA-binding protein
MNNKSKKIKGICRSIKKKYNFAPQITKRPMAKKMDKTEERIVAVEEAFGKTEQFIEKNQKIIMIVIGAAILIVLGYFGFKRLYIAPREQEAQTQMFMAEKYFEMDSVSKALKGDGNYLGFLDIIDQFSMTKSANLSHYYAGICYLKKGEYQKAIDQLNDFSSGDELVAPMALGALGDAHMELNNSEKAAEYYLKAADKKKNDLTSPMFLMKAGMAFEIMGKNDEALKAYDRVKKEFPRTTEGRDIEKYIARLSGSAKK